MLVIEGHLFGRSLWPALLVVLLFCAGCRTAPDAPLFIATGPGWRVQEGQAIWRPRQRLPELGGDVVIASHEDGRCVVQFAKTPVALVMAQTTRTNWLIRFPPRGLSFRGRLAPSTRFAWLYLHAALCGETLPADLVFQRKADGGWRLENTRSGESLEGFLAP